MQNPILISEGFENAAYSLRQTLSSFRFDTDGFERAVRDFQSSTDKLVRAMGMQAENDQRKHLGQSMAYVEKDFENI